MEYLKFSNGDRIPLIGLGTWRAPENEVEAAINLALEIGYRHFDCAPVYMNEKAIGKVFKSWIDSGRIKRSDLFITSKLPPFGNRAEYVEPCLKQSLADLQLDYLDLYLIHMPFAVPFSDPLFQTNEDGSVIQSPTDHVATWKEFERLKAEGLIKHIGISNFNERQIQRLLDNSSLKPEVLQIELHVYFQQKPLVKFCKENNIIVTAYSPLGSPGMDETFTKPNFSVPNLLENKVVVSIAKKHKKSPAQILLRYIIELGITTIPKSTNKNRLKANISIFDFKLDDGDKKSLSKIDAGIRIVDLKNIKILKGIETHPEFPYQTDNTKVVKSHL